MLHNEGLHPFYFTRFLVSFYSGVVDGSRTVVADAVSSRLNAASDTTALESSLFVFLFAKY